MIDYILFCISLFLFLISLVGIMINHTNFLGVLLCLELMILSCSIIFISISKIFNDPRSQIFALLLLVVSAGETAIGLGLIIKIYRKSTSINLFKFNRFKY